MSPELGASIVIITAALILYSIGVWSEFHARYLKKWHAAMFLLGLACDATGTAIMTRIAHSGHSIGSATLNTIMAWTGTAAIALMALHAMWAIVTLVRNDPDRLRTFHHFSLTVWAIWLIPYIVGAMAPMMHF